MKKLTGKTLAEYERKRDLNAELRAVLESPGKLRWARKTTFETQADGSIRRRVVRADGAVEHDTNIPAGQTIATAARAGSGLSQADFARLIGVSLRTLQEWEQGRRQPTGAAQVLLRIAAKHPAIMREATNA